MDEKTKAQLLDAFKDGFVSGYMSALEDRGKRELEERSCGRWPRINSRNTSGR